MPWKRKLHAAMYRHVAKRDGYKCVLCGVSALPYSMQVVIDGTKPLRCILPDGRKSILILDHIVSLRNGGDNSASNLQLLCDSCNSKKATTEDAIGGAR